MFINRKFHGFREKKVDKKEKDSEYHIIGAYQKRVNFSTEQQLVIGFACIILLGAFLLMLPVSNRSGTGISFVNALFTAVSATCVTGLVVFDTWTKFTFLGQAVILCLIQIGGLGFMTIAIEFSVASGRKIGLRERYRLSEAVGATQISGVVRLVKRILYGTFCVESVAAIILATRFVPLFGWRKGIWFAIFHSISAFCNAGFDLMGTIEPSSSLTHFAGDPVVCIVIALLFMIGGLGFLVWNELYDAVKVFLKSGKKSIFQWKTLYRRLSLHTHIVLMATLGITLVSTVILFLLERGNSLGGMPLWEKWTNSFFMAETPRTAGFNTIPISALHDSSLLLLTILMFFGAAPGGTGGGVKITTIMVALAMVIASIRGKEDIILRHYRISLETQRKAFGAIILYLGLAMTGILLLCTQGVTFRDATFECFSAIGTVGVTVGITPTLSLLSKIVIMLLMYIGRIGSLSVFVAFSSKRRRDPIRVPERNILI